METRYKINANYVSMYRRKKRLELTEEEKERRLQLKRRFREENKIENSLKNLNKGYRQNKNLSRTTIKKITNAIGFMNALTKNKRYTTKNGKNIIYKSLMITLTLSAEQIHDDKEIVKRILGNFIDSMRKTHDMQNYVWRAEKEKNNRIHFHLITDTAVTWEEATRLWNQSQNILGYIDRWREKRIAEAEKKGEILKIEQPNSVDILRITKKNNIERYITKYLVKNGKRKKPKNGKKQYGIRRTITKKITCRNYSMSYSLSRLEDWKKDQQDLAEFAFTVSRRLPNVTFKRNDYCEYIIIKLERLLALYKDFKEELLYRLEFSLGYIPQKNQPT